MALQHLLLISWLVALCKFQASNHARWLGLATFGFGLALWDKALFSWTLLPVVVIGVVLWPCLVRKHATARNIAIALLRFGLVTWPLLYYNVRHHWITFQSHVVFSTSELAEKAALLHYTADGSVLFG